MMVMQATEVKLPGDVSAVTRRAACDGVGVDVLLTPAVVAALIPGSVAPLPKAVIHAFRARLAKQGMPDGAVFYDACATSPSETDRWMHGPMFISWLRGARVFKAEANADAKAAAELAIKAVERLMDNGGGVEAAVAPAAAPESATAPATAKATPASKPAPKRAARKKKNTAVPSMAIETVRGRSPPLPRNSPSEFRGEFRGEFLSQFRSLLSCERFSLFPVLRRLQATAAIRRNSRQRGAGAPGRRRFEGRGCEKDANETHIGASGVWAAGRRAAPPGRQRVCGRQ